MAKELTETHDSTPAGPAAPAPEAQKGPGVQAVEGLLRQGAPEPEQIVAILDAHRGERDAIFALLHETLGNAYTQRVIEETGKLRASIERREVVAGDPSNPDGGFFEASQARGGAAWRTGDGRFTGTADRTGLDSRYQLDADDALHARIGADRTGSLAWERDGKTEAELYGSYRSGSDYEVGARRPWAVGGGTLTTGARHRVAGGSTTDGVFGSYRSTDGRTTADGDLGVTDGALAGSAAFTHAFNDTDQVSAGLTHGAAGTGLTASGTRRLEGGGTLGGTARLQHAPTGTTGSLASTYRTADGRTTFDGSVARQDGGFAGSAGVTHALTARDTLTGAVAHDPAGTSLTATAARQLEGGSLTGSARLHHGPLGTTGSISGAYRDATTQVDGSYARTAEADTFHLGGSHQPSPELTLAGHLDHERRRGGGDQTTFGLSERYRSGEMIHGLSLEGGRGERDFLGATGSIDARLAPRLYAGAWGGFQVEAGQQTTAQLGASLTFTPHEKAALTLAGVFDQDGVLETRLQLDVFKKKIGGVGDIADHKKDALVSLFLSYSQQAGRPSMLDGRYGAPQLDVGRPANDGQVMAGIRIRF